MEFLSGLLDIAQSVGGITVNQKMYTTLYCIKGANYLFWYTQREA
jgi:hypothetical protein